VAAGATVWAYAPPGVDAEALRQAGAQALFAHMDGFRWGASALEA
jgi:hypothetical protein